MIGRIAAEIGNLLEIDPSEDPRAFLVASCAMAAVRSAQHVLGHSRRKTRSFRKAVNEAFDALDGLDATLSRAVPRETADRTGT